MHLLMNSPITGMQPAAARRSARPGGGRRCFDRANNTARNPDEAGLVLAFAEVDYGSEPASERLVY